MLLELTIRNFAVIQDMTIEFPPGLTALTGETGAGKSIVIDALGAVLGARTSAELVRTGASGAYVEAVFDISMLPDPHPVQRLLEEIGAELDPSEPLVLARDVSSGGRSTARVGGRTVTAASLAALGEMLVDIHGQSDHLSLLRPAAQLDLLDRFAATLPLRHEVAEQFSSWQRLRQRVRDYDAEQRAAAQRLDLLRFQSEELGSAGLRPNEDIELAQERSILANAERLLRGAAEAQSALTGDADAALTDTGALDRMRAAIRALEDVALHDPSVEPVLVRLRDALFSAEDVAAELRDYAERVEMDPARLEASVMAYAEDIQREIEAIEGGEQDIEALRVAEADARETLAERAAALSSQRRDAALTLAQRVEQAIAELNMGRAHFEVRFERTPDPDGVLIEGEHVAVDATGIDRVIFYLAANAGEELRPLARVASGGETARLMLALKSILSDADETPILVFDEVDVGVGGRSGQVVGEKLWSLTDRHQAIVISHLPQIAAFADQHVILIKSEIEGRTHTTARAIDGADRIEELAAMLDGQPPTPESRANATALLERVNAWKATSRGRKRARR
jgi:DNA repair protein RecN (Recombination protein N)